MIMNTTRKNGVIGAFICIAVGVVIVIAGVELKAGTPEMAKPANTATNQSLGSLFQNPALASQEWDPAEEIQDMQTQMDKMQARMDKMLGQMSAEFRDESQFSGLPENPGYSLSLNVQDLKNRYVVRAFLPDTKASDVNVKLENKQTLQVSVSNGESQAASGKNMASNVSEWGQYEQMIQLPSPVKAGDMKVVREPHELLITLPKA
jgi:HSP20 family molecular chaperone IbpA